MVALNKAKVLVVSKPLVPPWDDGGKTLVRELVAHARSFLFKVPVTQEAEVPWSNAEAWPVYSNQVKYSLGLGAKLKLFSRLLYAGQSDIRHFFFAPNWISSLGCRLACWARSGPSVQTVCSTPASFSDAAKLLFGDKVVVLSEHTRQGFINSGIREDRIVLIPPGVSLPEVPDSQRITSIREGHSVGSMRVVMFAGDYDFSRAARTALEAAFRVCAQADDICFLFAGRIKNDNCSDEEQRLKALVAQSNLTNRIRFMNYVDDFLDLLAAVDLCILPAESVYAKVDLPLTLLEAMARMTPIVVADAGPLPELVEQDVGLKVPPSDPEALSAAILAILSDPDRLRAMGRNARQVVSDRFSAGRMAEKHEELYSSLLGSPLRKDASS